MHLTSSGLHQLLLNTLCSLNLSPHLLCWLHSYLTILTQQVAISGYLSTPCHALFGVLQGSILGPFYSFFILTIYSGFLYLFYYILTLFMQMTSFFPILCPLLLLYNVVQSDFNTILSWRLRFSAGSRMMEIGGSLKTSLKEINFRRHFDQML